MALNRTSDSLSKCDPNLYSNIYDVRKRPDIKNNPVAATRPAHKDTIEISRDKLKEEALNRLRHSSSVVIAQNSFMRVGKYLFLAVAFPPYLLLYGLPKWILVEGLPAVFSLCMMMWNKVRQKTKKSVDQGVLKTQQMFQYFQKLAQVFIQPVVRLAFEFRRAIRRFFDRGSQFFKGINEKIKLGLLIPGKKIAKGMERIQKKFVQMKEKLKQQTAQLADRLQDGIQWIRQTPLTFLSWGQLQFQRLKSQGATKSAPMVKRWRSSQQNAQKSAEWVARQVKRGADAIKRTFEPLAVFYRGRLQPVFRKIRGSIQGKWKRARDFFGQKHQQSLNYLENKQQRLKELSAQHLIHRIISQMWLPNRLKGWVQKWLSHPLVKGIFEAAVRLYALIASACLSAFSLLLQGISKGARLISQWAGTMGSYVKILGSQSSVFLNKGGRICRSMVFYALYYSLLYTFMAVIVLAWGIRSLGTLMGSLKNHIISLLQRHKPPRNAHK